MSAWIVDSAGTLEGQPEADARVGQVVPDVSDAAAVAELTAGGGMAWRSFVGGAPAFAGRFAGLDADVPALAGWLVLVGADRAEAQTTPGEWHEVKP